MAKTVKKIHDDDSRVVIELESRVVVLNVLPFDTDVDTDELLRIDYANILGEILTFPLVFNRIANLRAEMANIIAESKLDLEVYEAQLTEEYQKQLSAKTDKRITIKDVETAVLRDIKFQAKKKDFFRKEKNYAYVDALYWSAQSKDSKLNKLSEKIKPEEFEKDLVEGVINGVMIKSSAKVIK